MKTPFFARLPWRVPTNRWISGLPTVPSHFFCLKVHDVETETVFTDNAVNSFVAAFPDGLAGILTRAAVSHGQKEFDNQALKEPRRRRLHAREQFRRQASSHSDMGRFQCFLRRFSFHFRLNRQIR